MCARHLSNLRSKSEREKHWLIIYSLSPLFVFDTFFLWSFRASVCVLINDAVAIATFKLYNIATVLWQWKRELECESKKHCHDSVNNRKLKNAVRIGLYCWVWAIEVCSFGGSMVRASDFNGTLKRREFELRLRTFGFFSLFYNLASKNCHLLLEQRLDSKWWICWTVIYSRLLLN